jgi:hypothetical protein
VMKIPTLVFLILRCVQARARTGRREMTTVHSDKLSTEKRIFQRGNCITTAPSGSGFRVSWKSSYSPRDSSWGPLLALSRLLKRQNVTSFVCRLRVCLPSPSFVSSNSECELPWYGYSLYELR